MSKRIDVMCSVEIPDQHLNRINELHAELAEIRPGSRDYLPLWEELKRMQAHYLDRLDGEVLAYSNIAKDQLRALFAPPV